MNRTNKGVSLLLILGVNMNKLFADIGSRGKFSDFENNNVDNDLFIVTIIIIAIIIMVFYTIVKEKLKGDRENNNKSVENNSTSCPHKEVQIVSGKDSTQRENTVEEEGKSFANSNRQSQPASATLRNIFEKALGRSHEIEFLPWPCIYFLSNLGNFPVSDRADVRPLGYILPDQLVPVFNGPFLPCAV